MGIETDRDEMRRERDRDSEREVERDCVKQRE